MSGKEQISEPHLKHLRIEPKETYFYAQIKNFTIFGFSCGETSSNGNGKFDVLFTGQFYSVRMDASCVDDDSTITGQFPFWTKVESASTKLFMDGELVSKPMNVEFISQHKAFDKPDPVKVSSRNSYGISTFEWTPFSHSKEVIPHILYVTVALNATENPFTITRTVLGAIPNNGSFSWNIQSQHFVFIQLIDGETSDYCQTNDDKSLVPISASRSSGYYPI